MFDEFPVKSIALHHTKRSQLSYGMAESYKVTFNSTTALTDAALSKVWKEINGSRTIGRRFISGWNSTFGILGITPAGEWL